MKSIFLITLFLCSLALSGQEINPKKKLSKHEFGVSFDTYNGSNFTPKLNYKFYRTEKNVLNFGTSFHYNGFHQSYQFEFWNEYRNYIGSKEKWFISHGFAASVGYSKFDYQDFSNGQLVEGLGLGLGYNLGVGYKINDRFSIQANVKPKINYINHLQDNRSSEWKITSPLSLGVNFRF